MQCSVMVNTANRPEFLDRCIESYLRQSCLDFEMVIADDGSDEHTLEVILRRQAEAPFPIIHAWRPPGSYRRAETLNRGIAACNTGYIIFTDCDSLAPANFVETHLARRRPERMLVGGRVRLSQDQTEKLTMPIVKSGEFENLVSPEDLKELQWQHWKNRFHILIRKARRPHNLGLNMSMELSALEAVNGYDNFFEGWGNADGDLRERLKKAGVWPLSIWRECYVLHQWHPQARRNPANATYARRSEIPMYAENGLEQVRQMDTSGENKLYEEMKGRVD
jgi:glycosyltransferase involved in cell wall biosynthesis